MAKTLAQLSLGGAWLAAAGYSDVRELALGALELGFGAVLPAPSARLFPWADFRARTEDLPIEVPAIRVDPPFEAIDGSLASSRGDEVLAVRTRFERAAKLGRLLGVNLLIMEAPRVQLAGGDRNEAFETALEQGQEPDAELWALAVAQIEAQRDAVLERSCRNLHGLLKEFPDFRIALTESADLASLSRKSDLEAILDDLAGLGRLSYWHRPSVAAWQAKSGNVEAGVTLEILGKYLCGLDLADFGEHGPRAIPGSGIVDYGLLAPYVRGAGERFPLCLEPKPDCRSGEVRQGRAFLGKFGL